MSEKLKPCPFCGDPVYLVYSSHFRSFVIRHRMLDYKDCECKFEEFVMPIQDEVQSLADATLAWNRRCENG